MATLYLGLATMVSEFGLGAAVVNLRDLDREQVSQLNTVSLFVGLVLFGLSLAVARPMGWFFEEPGLPAVIVAMSVIYLVNWLRPIPLGILEKSLRYRALGLVDASKAIGGIVVTLFLAWRGYGYWALVGGFVAGEFAATACTLSMARHPFGVPRRASLTNALTFSGHVLTSRMAWFGYSNADFLIAGKVLGKGPLGLYSLAWTLAHAPLSKIISVITRVTPGIFAKVQKQPEELGRYLVLLIGAIPTMMIPLSWGAAVVAPTAIPLLLGEQWTGMVTPFQLLCVYVSYRSMTPLFSQLLIAVGDTRFAMRISFVLLLLLPPAFYFGSRWGPVGIALAWITVHPIVTSRLISRALRHADTQVRRIFVAVAPSVVSGVCMVLAVFALQAVWAPSSEVLALGAQIALGGVVYLGTLRLGFPRHVARLTRAGGLLRG